MPSFILEIDSGTSHDLAEQRLLNLLIETDYPDSAQSTLPLLLNILQSKAAHISVVDENYINQSRLLKLKRQFTPKILNLILESVFEYGIDSQADVFIRSQMKENSLVTKNWLNEIFVEHFSNPVILIGILRIISRLFYYAVYPEGQLMATTALSHSNVEVQECGVRAFESWGTLDSLRILNNIKVVTPWLQDYVNEVVKDLSRGHNVPVG
ncbi:hypothetical protein ES706_02027 [subsurface metagenome]|nr:hypothetical protein [Dehalococcoidia bacterium]